MGLMDDLGLGGLNFNINGIIGTGANAILLVLLVCIIGVLAYILYDKTRYVHKFRIKDVTNNRKIISDTKAKEFKRKEDNALYWKLASTKEVLPIPPPEAIEVDKRGHKCVEGYKLATGEYIFARDQISFKEPPANVLNETDPDKRKQLMDEWRKDNPQDKVIDSAKLLSTNSRLILINQIRKAHMRKSKKLSEMLPQIVALGVLAIVVVSLMIFYGDMGKPLLSMADNIKAWQDTQLQMVTEMKDMKQNIQSINEELGNKQSTSKAVPPS